MVLSIEDLSEEFLEFSSEQRLNILLNLSEKKYKISAMAKKLDATVPEVHRNFSRLTKTGLIIKDTEGDYSLTEYGKISCMQLPLFQFLISHKSYFKTHTLGNLPIKFSHRLSSLANSKVLSGYVKVLEKWKDIYENSDQYLYNILVEVSYSKDLMSILVKKLNDDTKINSIFAENAIVTKERKAIVKQKNFKKFINDESLKRKMNKNIQIVIVMNEKEAGISFPSTNGDVDMSKMFYSTNESFHEWCFDYFQHMWKNSHSFQESKLQE